MSDFKLGIIYLDKTKFMNKKLPTMEDIPIINLIDQLKEIDNDLGKRLTHLANNNI